MEQIDFMTDLPGIESAYHPRVESVGLPQTHSQGTKTDDKAAIDCIESSAQTWRLAFERYLQKFFAWEGFHCISRFSRRHCVACAFWMNVDDVTC